MTMRRWGLACALVVGCGDNKAAVEAIDARPLCTFTAMLDGSNWAANPASASLVSGTLYVAGSDNDQTLSFEYEDAMTGNYEQGGTFSNSLVTIKLTGSGGEWLVGNPYGTAEITIYDVTASHASGAINAYLLGIMGPDDPQNVSLANGAFDCDL